MTAKPISVARSSRLPAAAPDSGGINWSGWVAPLAGISVFVVAHAVYNSWKWLVRPFWGDEAMHNCSILASSSLPDLVARIGFMSQPLLDHVLRKYFWFPIFGFQELGLRLPSIAYFWMLLVAGVLITAWFLKKNGHPSRFALFAALLVGLWMTNKPSESWYAYEARHYSLVSLLSLCWFSLAMLGSRPTPVLWWTVTVLFANVHFFALPVIAFVGVLDSWEAYREKGRRAGLLVLAGIAAVGAVTILVNLGAWRELTGHPPGARPEVLAGLKDAVLTFIAYIKYLGFPQKRLLVVLVWAGLLLAARRRDAGRLLLFVLVFFPLFLVAVKLKSNYAFGDRYYSPFFGAAFVTMVLALDRGRIALDSLIARRRLSSNAGRGVRWASLVLLFVMFGVGAACLHLTRLGRVFYVPRQNGGETARVYEEIKKADKPVLLISESWWNWHRHILYLGYVGTPFRAAKWPVHDKYLNFISTAYRHEVRLVKSQPLEGDVSQVPGEIRRFFADYPDGLVVLDQTDTANGCGSLPLPKLGKGITVTKPSDVLCIWLARGIRNPADLKRVARAVQFRSLDWWQGK